MARVFISHSSRDQDQAARLMEWLRAQGFFETFLDFDKHAGLAPGSDWERTLYREITRAEAVILILTVNWFDSKWCFAEFTQARALGKTIFPLIESPKGEASVASDIQHLDLIKDREGGLERLAAELMRIALNARGGFHWDSSRSPFPGLLAFDEADAAIYFGRDDDIRRLVERLNARRAQGGAHLVALFGASGSGKSSLLRAGVLPRLRRDRRNWIVLPPFRPQINPIDELAQAISTGLGKRGDWKGWRNKLLNNEAQEFIPDLVQELRAAHGANEAQILISIDQAEELFGTADKAQAERVFAVLNTALDERLPFIALLGLPSHYLGHLQQAPGFGRPFEEFSLKPLPLERVRNIIEGPARVAGLAVDDALIAAAVKDAVTEDALPLLAFALRELYDRFASSGQLTVAEYRALGDDKGGLSPLENAVRRKAEDILAEAKPSSEDLQALKEAFVPEMVRVNAEGEYVRRPAVMNALPTRAWPLIERLARARLLVLRQEGGTAIVEVAHEALLRKWPLLRGWLDTEREFLMGKGQLEQDLRDWEKAGHGQKDEGLLSGLKLTRARTWLEERPHQLSERERRFIQESIARHEEERNRRERVRWRVQAGSVSAALVLVVVAALAVWQGHVAGMQRALAVRELKQTQISHSRFLVSALANEPDPQIAKAVALTALPSRLDDPRGPSFDPALLTRLWTADAEDRLRVVLVDHLEGINQAAFSPDGTLVVTVSGDMSVIGDVKLSIDSTARIWNARTGAQLVGPMEHDNKIFTVAFSPDGRRILTASSDGTAQLWDAHSGAKIGPALKTERTVPMMSAAFSPDGKRIVTASYDGTARVWDAGTSAPVGSPLKDGGGAPMIRAAFSPDGKRIVTASGDGTVRVWDAQMGAAKGPPLGKANRESSVAFSPDGGRIVTASGGATAQVWNSKTFAPVGVPLKHKDEVVSALFSPDGTRVVTASADRTAAIWDAQTGASVVPPLKHDKGVISAVYSRDGGLIVTTSIDHTARLWDARTGALIAVFRGHDGKVTHAEFSPDGMTVVTTSVDKTARLWDARPKRQVAILREEGRKLSSAVLAPRVGRIITIPSEGPARLWDSHTYAPITQFDPAAVGPPFSPERVKFSADETRVVLLSRFDRGGLWDATSGRFMTVLQGQHGGPVAEADFSPDGTRLVTALLDGTSRLWDPQSGSVIALLEDDAGPVNIQTRVVIAKFRPDGAQILSTMGDDTVRLWDARTGARIARLKGRESAIADAVFSPDGARILVVYDDHSAQVWDAQTHLPVGSPYMIPGTIGTGFVGFNKIAFSRDGSRLLAARAGGPALLLDGLTGAVVAQLEGHLGSTHTVQFSPDGARIATTGEDGTARLWEGRTGALLATLVGRGGQITSVVFRGDSRQLVTVSNDSAVQLWDGLSGLPVDVFVGHTDKVNSAVYSPDGTLITTASDDSTARLWRVNDASVDGRLALVRATLSTSLSKKLQHRYAVSEEIHPSQEHDASMLACDRLAADPEDRRHLGPGVYFDVLDAESARSACQTDIRLYPREPRLHYQLARGLVKLHQWDGARAELNIAQRKNYAAAFFLQGLLYANGAGVPKNVVQALQMFERAEKLGMVKAASQIAVIQWFGADGVPPNPGAAFATLQRGSQQGDPDSNVLLAFRYEQPNLSDLGKAFFHHALATRLLVASHDEAGARRERVRRAALAHNLPIEDISRLMLAAEAWRVGDPFP